MQTVRIPKRVPVELLRAKLGDARAERLLTEMFGDRLVPVVPLRLRKDTLQLTLGLLTDQPPPDGDSRKWQLVPTLFRAYFAEHAQARGKVIKWMREKIEAMNLEEEMAQRAGHSRTNGNGAVAATKPKGRKTKARRR